MCSEWQKTTLGEVFDVRDGTHDSPKYQDEGYPLITSKNLKNGSLSFEKVNFISKVDFEKINVRSEVHKGDILFAMIGTIGNPVLIIEEPVFAIKNVALFKVPKTQSGKFLKYYLESPFVTEKMSKEAKGTTQKFVGLGYLRKFPISLPPIPEQQRIVAILDQAFADIEKARANAERNLKNVRELFDSYLNQVFSQRGEGWVEEVLGSVCDVRDGTHDSPKYVDEGIPFITQKNIRTDGLSFEKTKFISETDHIKFSKRSNVTYGDILISMIGVNRGMACVVDDRRIFSIKNVGLIKKALNINPFFLLFYLKSQNAKKYIESESRGGAQPFIGLTKLRTFPILLASPEEQEEVVSNLILIENCTENLVSVYEAKLDSLDELKKSLLQKAFSGELTQSKGIAV